MANDVNFDLLTQKTVASNGALEDLNALYGAAFALPEWHFIARGRFPNIHPYIAANAGYAGGQNMVRAFTDTARLMRFARENELTAPGGTCDSLSIPTGGIVEYLEGFIADGVDGIWFNSDSESDGFFVPLKQLRPIKAHLEKLGMLKPAANGTGVATLLVVVRDALMLPSGFVSPASYTCNYFCRVPAGWTDGDKLKDEHLEKIYRQVYGPVWRAGNSDGSRYVVQDSYSKVFPPETVKTTTFAGTENTADNHFWFYLADEAGAINNVTADEFQAAVDAEFRPAPPAEPDPYINAFRQGAVKPETSLTPFFKAIAPLLENYAGAGEFTESFSPGTDQTDMSDLFEDVTKNSHGPYLKYKSYTYRRFGTEPPVKFQTIGSNLLRHADTAQPLIVNFTLSREPAAAKLIVRFLGRESAVEKLLAAVEPALDACDFQVLLEMKGEPPPASLKLLGLE